MLLNSKSIVSIAASIVKINSIGTRLSPCFTPTLDSNSIAVLPLNYLIHEMVDYSFKSCKMIKRRYTKIIIYVSWIERC